MFPASASVRAGAAAHLQELGLDAAQEAPQHRVLHLQQRHLRFQRAGGVFRGAGGQRKLHRRVNVGGGLAGTEAAAVPCRMGLVCKICACAGLQAQNKAWRPGWVRRTSGAGGARLH